MKILYYSPHPTVNYSAPSGPGTHIREVIGAFENHGHQVLRLICGGEQLSTSAAIQFKKSRIKQFIPSIVWQSLKDYQLKRIDQLNKAKLESLILKEKPDLIYERSYYLMQSGYTTARQLNIPYYCEINAPYPEEKVQMEGRSFFILQAKRVEKEQVLAADRVFTVSSALKNYLLKNSGCETKKIVVTPNAVNQASIIVSKERVNEIRASYGLQSDDKVIGFVGSIFPYHGVDLLLEAFSLMQGKAFNKYKLMIVGDGETLPALRQFAAQHIALDKVIFTGNVPHNDVYNHIALMDITVMARSNWYGSPVKIFEYGAMQKAIIAPDVVPVQDVMVNEKHGLLINDNTQDLLAAISHLADQPQAAKEMADAFYFKVLKEHTWMNVASQILSEAP